MEDEIDEIRIEEGEFGHLYFVPVKVFAIIWLIGFLDMKF